MYYKVNLIEKGVYIWFEKLKKKYVGLVDIFFCFNVVGLNDFVVCK